MTYPEYLSKVKVLTAESAPSLPDIEKRGLYTFHVDHIVPVSWGYKLGIPPEKISSIENLQVISREANSIKGNKITPEGEAVLKAWKYKMKDIYARMAHIKECEHEGMRAYGRFRGSRGGENKPDMVKCLYLLGFPYPVAHNMVYNRTDETTDVLLRLINDLKGRGISIFVP